MTKEKIIIWGNYKIPKLRQVMATAQSYEEAGRIMNERSDLLRAYCSKFKIDRPYIKHGGDRKSKEYREIKCTHKNR